MFRSKCLICGREKRCDSGKEDGHRLDFDRAFRPVPGLAVSHLQFPMAHAMGYFLSPFGLAVTEKSQATVLRQGLERAARTRTKKASLRAAGSVRGALAPRPLWECNPPEPTKGSSAAGSSFQTSGRDRETRLSDGTDRRTGEAPRWIAKHSCSAGWTDRRCTRGRLRCRKRIGGAKRTRGLHPREG